MDAIEALTTRALYLRIKTGELQRFLERPDLIFKLDVRPAIADGRVRRRSSLISF